MEIKPLTSGQVFAISAIALPATKLGAWYYEGLYQQELKTGTRPNPVWINKDGATYYGSVLPVVASAFAIASAATYIRNFMKARRTAPQAAAIPENHL